MASDYGFKIPLTIPDEIKHDLDKYLAHLTYSRTMRLNPEQEWQRYVNRFLPSFLEVCIKFVDFILQGEGAQATLPKDQQDNWRRLLGYLQHWRESIRE